MFSSPNQYTSFSYLLDEAEGYTSEDQHQAVALQHPQYSNDLAPPGGEFSEEQRFRHREDFGMSLFYSEHEQQGQQGQQDAYNGSSRQGQQLLHQQQDQEQLQYQQQEYEARLKNTMQPPSPFFVQHLQNSQNQEGFSRIAMTVADPISNSSSLSSLSGPSQTREQMIPHQRTKEGVLSPVPSFSNQVQTHADASSRFCMLSKNNREDTSSSVHVASLLEPEKNKNPNMPMVYTPSSIFHNATAMMYQEGAFNRRAGSSSGPVMQLTDPSPHVPASNNNRTSTYPDPSLKHPGTMPFSRRQGFDVSVDPLKRARDITSSIGPFPSSFSHDASTLDNKDLDWVEKKCYARIVEAGISSTKNKSIKSKYNNLKQETSPSPSKSPKKEDEDVLRPLSAYNFFFSDERDRLLNGKDTSMKSYEMRKEQLLAQHVAKDRSKRRPHRKTHGKITFTTLSKLIGQRWRQLPEVEKNFYKEVAKADLMRYHDELATTVPKKQDMAHAAVQ
jgi:hypothetical protein